jgi:hypothetical protein
MSEKLGRACINGANKMREKLVCMGEWRRQGDSARGKVNFRLICNYVEE